MVHYNGWKKKWDEWVPESRIMPKTAENEELKKQMHSNVAKGKSSEKNLRKRSNDGSPELLEAEISQEYQIPLHGQLKLLLVDDWEKITRKQMLHRVPASVSVKQTLDDYTAYINKIYKSSEHGKSKFAPEMAKGVLLYFEKALPILLLYKFERLQLAEMHKSGLSFADVYPPTFILRLLVKMPLLLSQSGIDPVSRKAIIDYISNLQVFLSLETNNEKYFSESFYFNAERDYISKSSE